MWSLVVFCDATNVVLQYFLLVVKPTPGSQLHIWGHEFDSVRPDDSRQLITIQWLSFFFLSSFFLIKLIFKYSPLFIRSHFIGPDLIFFLKIFFLYRFFIHSVILKILLIFFHLMSIFTFALFLFIVFNQIIFLYVDFFFHSFYLFIHSSFPVIILIFKHTLLFINSLFIGFIYSFSQFFFLYSFLIPPFNSFVCFLSLSSFIYFF